MILLKKSFFLLILFFPIFLAADIQWDVNDINFVGNHIFDRAVLIDQMKLKPERLFRKTSFSMTQLQQDISSLNSFYRNRGFFQAEIRSSLDFDSTQRKVNIYLLITEGVRTKLDSFEFIGNILHSDSTLSALTRLKKGSILDSSLYTGAQSKILEFYASLGRVFARVEYFFEFDQSGETADLIFTINEGPLVRAGEISILGLKKTDEKVIRRELQFDYNEILNAEKIRSSINNLYTTGLFSLASIIPIDTMAYPSESDTVTAPVLIQVEEGDFFNIQLGAGYNSIDKWYGTAELAYKNLFGLGHRIYLSSRLSSVVFLAQIGYNYPWLFGRDLLGEINGYIERRDLESFKALYQGGLIAVNGNVGERNRYRLFMNFMHNGWFRGEQQGPEKNNTLLFGTRLTRDTRDTYLDPGNAFFSFIEAEIAGFSFSNQFYRFKWDVRLYRGLFGKRLNISSALFLGYVNDFGSSDLVPPSELFRIGIDDIRPVRGYVESQVSSVNKEGEAVGGELAAVINLFDIRFPILSIFSGEIFVDGGYVWPKAGDFSLEKLRWSVGPGLLINLPSGIFRIDYGFELKRKFDFTGGWYFGLGYAF
jgi:outer membrane protein insertion porin family